MKTTSHLSQLAVIVAALALGIAAATAQSTDIVRASKNQNRAVMASPRAKEVFPWLTRSAAPRTETCCVAIALSEVSKNRAFAASPRVLEQFPELARSAPTQPEFTIAPLVEKNLAMLSNPRRRENHPELSRGASTGTAKGGAAKLMELAK